MARMTKKALRFLLNPDDPLTRATVRRILDELRTFEGKTVLEMMDGLEEINRSEPSEQWRRLRVELAEHLAESSQPELSVEPSDARRTLFASVWDRGLGFVTSGIDLFQPPMEEFYGEAARQLCVAPRTLKECLYADIPEVRRVTIPPMLNSTPPELIIGRVNLSRLKKNLRSAVRVKLRIRRATDDTSNYTAILWSLKRHGLMYEVSIEGDRLTLLVRGPAAIIEKTTVYGNRLASCVADVLGSGSFETMLIELRAHGRGTTPRDTLEEIHLDSSMRGHFRSEIEREVEQSFKSSDEAVFQKYFTQLNSGWVLRYEGTIIPLIQPDGRPAGFLVPDFVAKNPQDGRSALIEIVGFWRTEYLRRKIEKVSLVGGQQLFLIVNGALKLDRTDIEHLERQHHVFFYTGRRGMKEAAEEVARMLARAR
jgi:predicted nuclease of restriction endonuclease-like RecB superfamily